MNTAECPVCGFAEAEATEVFNIRNMESVGYQVSCPECRKFTAPDNLEESLSVSS